MASKVTVKNSSLIPAKHHDNASSDNSEASQRIVLPVFSQVLWSVPYTTRFLFFESPALAFDGVVSHLKASLAEALVEFYPLAGRLNIQDDGLMEVLCNNQGVLFIESSAQVSLRELQKNDLNGHFEGIPDELLLDLAQTCGHAVEWPWPSDAPLFIIQVTQLSCGGICMSIRFSHQLLDGTTTWHFVKSWAELSRGESISLHPLVKELPVPDVESTQELPSHYILYKNSDLNSAFGMTTDAFKSCEMKCFCFKKEMIQKLKQENPGFTSFQLLTAHIWNRATAARKLHADETTSLLFAFNCRGRVEWIPEGFLGEAAFMSQASARAGDLKLATGAEFLKKAIHESVQKVSDIYNMLGHRDKDHTMMNRTDKGKDLIVGSSFYSPVFQDFGFGKAVGMTIVPVRLDGNVCYFPGREPGYVAAYIALKSEVMSNFELSY